MLMRALKPWVNTDIEGRVETGDEFNARPDRARELERLGLALPAMSETAKIVVRADPPPPATAAPTPAKEKRRSARS